MSSSFNLFGTEADSYPADALAQARSAPQPQWALDEEGKASDNKAPLPSTDQAARDSSTSDGQPLGLLPPPPTIDHPETPSPAEQTRNEEPLQHHSPGHTIPEPPKSWDDPLPALDSSSDEEPLSNHSPRRDIGQLQASSSTPGSALDPTHVQNHEVGLLPSQMRSPPAFMRDPSNTINRPFPTTPTRLTNAAPSEDAAPLPPSTQPPPRRALFGVKSNVTFRAAGVTP